MLWQIVCMMSQKRSTVPWKGQEMGDVEEKDEEEQSVPQGL